MIGSGVGAMGALSALALYSEDKMAVSEVVWYRPDLDSYLRFVDEESQGRFTVKTGRAFGGASVWGGMLAYPSRAKYQNSPLVELLGLRNPLEPLPGEKAIYQKIAPVELITCFHQHLGILKGRKMLRNIPDPILSIDCKGGRWIVNGKRTGSDEYDRIILAAGTVGTSRLLSEMMGIYQPIKVLDHSMCLHQGAALEGGSVDYSKTGLQFVDRPAKGLVRPHSLQVMKRVMFPRAGFHAFRYAYCLSNSAQLSEKLNWGKKLAGEILKGKMRMTVNSRPVILSSYSARFSNVWLDLNAPTPTVSFASITPGAVPSFHLHSAISSSKSASLASAGCYVSDGAALPDLLGINPVGSIFDLGFQNASEVLNLAK